MRKFFLVLSTAIFVAACSTTESTQPKTMQVSDRASYQVGPNDNPAGNWNCTGTIRNVQNCLGAATTGDTTTQKVLNLQIAFVNQIIASVSGGTTTFNCTATSGGQLYTDRTTGQITNGEPQQQCHINTPQNVQTVIVYPPYTPPSPPKENSPPKDK